MQPLKDPICCTFKLYPMIIEMLAAKADPNNISSAQLLRIFVGASYDLMHENYIEPPRRGKKKMVNFRLTEKIKARIVELAHEWDRSQSDILAILIWNGELRTEHYISRREA